MKKVVTYQSTASVPQRPTRMSICPDCATALEETKSGHGTGVENLLRRCTMVSMTGFVRCAKERLKFSHCLGCWIFHLPILPEAIETFPPDV